MGSYPILLNWSDKYSFTVNNLSLIIWIQLDLLCRYRQLKQQHELKLEEEQILQAKVQQSSFHQQQEELERLRKTIGQNAKIYTQKTFLTFGLDKATHQ